MAEQFQNFYVTKLREACDATATTIYVETVPSITEGTLVLEYANSTKHEIIHFTGVSGYGLTGCTRGLEGTTAQSHSAGTDVRQNLTAGMVDKIINGVITTENIADSAVTTAKINNGAVTADKIDFTTLLGESERCTVSGVSSSNVFCQVSPDKKFGFIRGYIQGYGGSVASIQTPFRPSSNTSIDVAALMFINSGIFTYNGLTIDTDGVLKLGINSGWGTGTQHYGFLNLLVSLS